MQEEGEDDPNSRGEILLWTTDDFMEFSFLGLLPLGHAGQVDRVRIGYDREAGQYAVVWTDETGCWQAHSTDLSGWLLTIRRPAVWEDGESLLPCRTVRYSAARWQSTPICTTVSARIGAVCLILIPSCPQKFAPHRRRTFAPCVRLPSTPTVPLLCKKSTGISPIDFSKPGVYEIEGEIRSNPYRFPLTHGTGDPVIVPWEGKYYYLSTSDTTGDVGLYVREADTPEGLFAPDIELHLILPYDEERQFIQTFWAPEFHIVGGEPYIFFAVSGNVWGPQCHVMHLKPGGRFTDPDAWETPRRVLQMDGTPLTEKGITLDMTVIKAGGRVYAAWSYRFGMGTPLDTGSMLYIAPLNEEEPWKLAGEPALLSRPLLSWENLETTVNNEGPYAFVTEDRVYLAYSAGSANSYTYAVGLLTADPQGGSGRSGKLEKKG